MTAFRLASMRNVAGLALAGLLAACAAGGSAPGAPAQSAASGSSAAPAATGAQPAAPASASAPSSAASAGAAGQPQQAGSVQASPPPLNPPVSVKLGSLSQTAEVGTYLALDRGYFEAEGLEVNIVPFPNAPDQIPAVSSNDVQFSSGLPSAAFYNAVARDVGIKIITPLTNYTPDMRAGGLVMRQDLLDSGRYKELKDMKDMKDMTIGFIGQGSASQMYAERARARAGLGPDEVDLVPIGLPDSVAALGNKKLDGAFLFDPVLTIAEEQNVGTRVNSIGEFVTPGTAAGVIMVGAGFATSQPEVVKRFVTAHMRGQRDYYNAFWKDQGDKTAIYNVLAKYSTLKDVNLAQRLEPLHIDPNGYYDDTELGLMQDFFMRIGAQREKVDVSKIVDKSYVDYALQRLGRM